MAEQPPKPQTEVSETPNDAEFAYTLKDKVFGELKVKKSANAWWLDSGKVIHLIDAYKFDATDEESCSYAGISLDQLRYFREQHPTFSQVKDACKELPNLVARKTVVGQLATNPDMAFRYLERKKKKEFGANLDLTSDGEKIEGVQVEIVEGRKPPKPISNDEASTESEPSVSGEPPEQG